LNEGSSEEGGREKGPGGATCPWDSIMSEGKGEAERSRRSPGYMTLEDGLRAWLWQTVGKENPKRGGGGGKRSKNKWDTSEYKVELFPELKCRGGRERKKDITTFIPPGGMTLFHWKDRKKKKAVTVHARLVTT